MDHLFPQNNRELAPVDEHNGEQEAETLLLPPQIEVKQQQKVKGTNWQIGDIVMDLYEIKQIHTGGGMGLVYRARHKSWNIDLAIKSPRKDYLKTEKQKEDFIRECETWIDLGLHPHIVSCFYVRRIDEIPHIFAEYVEGATLSEWIRHGTLYSGSQDSIVGRILDIAIQMAWGLQYAHEKGLVHQDIKPQNLMLSRNGAVKVTDFGIARARGVVEKEIPEAQKGIEVSYLGMTRAYCSPEQGTIQGLREKNSSRQELPKLTLQSDMWSWAVSITEMFLGKREWELGSAAGHIFETCAVQNRFKIPMPQNLTDILRQCFKTNPEDRFKGMDEIASEIIKIYRQKTGKEYFREEPKAAELLADSLNNHAVSLLDLGYKEQAEKFFDKALKTDPLHLEAAYNMGLLDWRNAKVTDDSLISKFQKICASFPTDWRPKFFLGSIHLERGDAESAVSVLSEALDIEKDNIEIRNALNIANSIANKQKTVVRIFEGHTGKITSVSMSSDGKWGLSKSDDNTDRIWELSTGKCINVFSEKKLCLSFISDNRHLLLANTDENTMSFCEVLTGKNIKKFRKFDGIFGCVSCDGKFLITVEQANFNELEYSSMRFRLRKSFRDDIRKENNVTYSDEFLIENAFSILDAEDDLNYKRYMVDQWKSIRDESSSITLAPAILKDIEKQEKDIEKRSKYFPSKLYIWDLHTNNLVRKIKKAHKFNVDYVCISSDCKWLMSKSIIELIIWELSTGKKIKTVYLNIELYIADSFRFDVTSDFKLGLISYYDQLIRYDLNTGNPITHYKTKYGNLFWHKPNEIKSIRISSDGLYGLSGSEDKTVRYWELSTGRCIRTFEGHSDKVNSVCISPDSQFGLSGSDDGTMRLWHFKDTSHPADFIISIPRDSDESFKMTNKVQNSINKIRSALQAKLTYTVANEIALILSLPGYKRNPFLLDLHREMGLNGKHIAFKEGWIHQSLDSDGRTYSVSISSDGKWGLSEKDGGPVTLWNLSEGKSIRTFEANGELMNVCFTPDPQLGFIDDSNSLRLVNLSTGDILKDLNSPILKKAKSSFKRDSFLYYLFGELRSNNESISLCSGNSLIMTGYGNNVKLWNINNGRRHRKFKGHTATVKSVSIGSNGLYGLSGSFDKTLKLWNFGTGKCIRTFKGHSDEINSVSISPDGSLGLSGAKDGTIKLWELSTGKCINTFEGHFGPIFSVTFTPDGKWGIAGGEDKIIRIWNLDTGTCEGTLVGHNGPVLSVSISIDGQWLFSGGVDNKLLCWRLVWKYDFQKPIDWDEGARSYLETFLTVHCAIGRDGISRVGKPVWNDKDFEKLFTELQYRGYGSLHSEGVRKELEKMVNEWKGPTRIGIKSCTILIGNDILLAIGFFLVYFSIGISKIFSIIKGSIIYFYKNTINEITYSFKRLYDDISIFFRWIWKVLFLIIDFIIIRPSESYYNILKSCYNKIEIRFKTIDDPLFQIRRVYWKIRMTVVRFFNRIFLKIKLTSKQLIRNISRYFYIFKK